MKRSKIGYCDYSGGDLNFVTGCTPVSPGCRECYARRIYERFGRDFSKVTVHWDKLERSMRKAWPMDGNVRGPHSSPILFLCDTGDLFHRYIPFSLYSDLFNGMALRADRAWLLLTKRAEGMLAITREMFRIHKEGRLPHIWIGVTAENQEMLAQRWTHLALTPVGKRWLSVEPMLGPVDLGDANPDWVVCGAESGPGRRPFDVAWAADLKCQCDERGIAFFGKQDSGLYPGVPLLIDGQEYKAWPR